MSETNLGTAEEWKFFSSEWDHPPIQLHQCAFLLSFITDPEAQWSFTLPQEQDLRCCCPHMAATATVLLKAVLSSLGVCDRMMRMRQNRGKGESKTLVQA